MQSNEIEILKDRFRLSEKTIELYAEAEKELEDEFKKIDDAAAYNQLKVLSEFQKNRVSYAHFGETSGYGYDDMGRDTLDKIYAGVFGAEDAMVRHNIVSGTQAIAACLYAVLRPGDLLVSVAGRPYDTLEEVIGLRGEPDSGSLADFGVMYGQVDLTESGEPDFDAIADKIEKNRVKAALIQRSRGYDWRDSLTVDTIGEIIKTIKAADKDVICIVDNCYGEFV